MTPEKAVEILKANEETKIVAIYNSVKRAAIKALEKQIPKKGRYTYLSSYTDDPPVMICPCCQNTHPSAAANLYKFCPDCGQALDWSNDTK